MNHFDPLFKDLKISQASAVSKQKLWNLGQQPLASHGLRCPEKKMLISKHVEYDLIHNSQTSTIHRPYHGWFVAPPRTGVCHNGHHGLLILIKNLKPPGHLKQYIFTKPTLLPQSSFNLFRKPGNYRFPIKCWRFTYSFTIGLPSVFLDRSWKNMKKICFW